MSWGDFIFVPMILFLIFVAPLWVVMHYRSKGRSQGMLTEDERGDLERLASSAEDMRERIETLESILDAETPDWRRRNTP
ncbi:MAG: envelope stress response membrane protein PspB [Gammaproteobacteria bacterium]|nr:envelope stress response membrane protein PspB [Gammaproteobacteria bacterium]MXY56723.1 envelope stress response membrane protein PspB [Gammaproteobacteria bacterium]MYF30876.1 envelope stress response membrane protein PspB [Gammaproteobacteria bacterium]MYK45686.1 envelope stress response membrane protein PspB [Gammaproteobacteria bacterium]